MYYENSLTFMSMRTCWFVGHLIFGSDQYHTLVHINELLRFSFFFSLCISPFQCYSLWSYASNMFNIFEDWFSHSISEWVNKKAACLFVCFNCHIYYIISVDLVTMLFIRSGLNCVCVTTIEFSTTIIALQKQQKIKNKNKTTRLIWRLLITARN